MHMLIFSEEIKYSQQCDDAESSGALSAGGWCIYLCINPIFNIKCIFKCAQAPAVFFTTQTSCHTGGPLGPAYCTVFFFLAEISAEDSSLNNTTLNPPVLSIKGQAGRYCKLVGLAQALHRPEKNICTGKWAVITVALRLCSVCAHLFCLLPPRSSCTHKYIITPTARHDDFCFHQLSEVTWITHHCLTQMQPSDMLITAYITAQPSFQDLNCGHTVLLMHPDLL